MNISSLSTTLFLLAGVLGLRLPAIARAQGEEFKAALV
jgi:hypothetical protein